MRRLVWAWKAVSLGPTSIVLVAVKLDVLALVRYEFESILFTGREPLTVYGGGRFGSGMRLVSVPPLRGMMLRVMSCGSVLLKPCSCLNRVLFKCVG